MPWRGSARVTFQLFIIHIRGGTPLQKSKLSGRLLAQPYLTYNNLNENLKVQ